MAESLSQDESLLHLLLCDWPAAAALAASAAVGGCNIALTMNELSFSW